MSMLDDYAEVVGADVIDHLRQLAEPLRGKRVIHVNSTRVGGGVAEILYKLVPLMEEGARLALPRPLPGVKQRTLAWGQAKAQR